MKAPAPYVKHQPTSKAAAHAIGPDLGRLQRTILDLLTQAGARGLTDNEMQHRAEMRDCTQTPRRIELVDKGYVVESGRHRRTGSGRFAIVWVLRKYNPQAPRTLPRARKKADIVAELRLKVGDLEDARAKLLSELNAVRTRANALLKKRAVEIRGLYAERKRLQQIAGEWCN